MHGHPGCPVRRRDQQDHQGGRHGDVRPGGRRQDRDLELEPMGQLGRRRDAEDQAGLRE